mmetsp:Transcript_14616/g.41645  ORF Transcript_14616/g.41645 Transcript_14616/m.41645 type:complete len:219 (+) Transcript_14616:1058-1714(+)
MYRLRLCRRRESYEFVSVHACVHVGARGGHRDNVHVSLGERPSLVEDHGGDVRHALHNMASLNQNTTLGCGRRRDEDGCRRGKAQRARTRHHQHVDGQLETEQSDAVVHVYHSVAKSNTREGLEPYRVPETEGDGRGRHDAIAEPPSDAVCEPLNRSFLALSLCHQLSYSRQSGCFPGGCRPHEHRRVVENRPSSHTVPRPLVHRSRLSCEQRLVNGT